MIPNILNPVLPGFYGGVVAANHCMWCGYLLNYIAKSNKIHGNMLRIGPRNIQSNCNQ